jgi:hypothetical protein
LNMRFRSGRRAAMLRFMVVAMYLTRQHFDSVQDLPDHTQEKLY